MSIPSPADFVRQLRQMTESRCPCAVATVVEVIGSASAGPGAKAIIDASGRTVYGWVGGGCAETAVRDEALAALADGRPRLLRVDLDDEVLGVGMPCGGQMNVYVEPLLPEPTLLVLGHGRIAEATVSIGKLLEFRVVVDDPLATSEAFPLADLTISDDPDYAKAECDSETYVVITTQHRGDYEALSRVLRQGPAWVGLVASRKRSALVIERLYEDGFSADELRRVAAPCGLDIGAATPQEIALSIMSEVLQVRRGYTGSGRPLRDVKGVRITEDGIEVPDGPLRSDKCPS